MSETANDTAPLTVVLVHGAFADASSWNGEADGSHVITVSQPETVAQVILSAVESVDLATAGAARWLWT